MLLYRARVNNTNQYCILYFWEEMQHRFPLLHFGARRRRDEGMSRGATDMHNHTSCDSVGFPETPNGLFQMTTKSSKHWNTVRTTESLGWVVGDRWCVQSGPDPNGPYSQRLHFLQVPFIPQKNSLRLVRAATDSA